jgi:HlyD family secretion protein
LLTERAKSSLLRCLAASATAATRGVDTSTVRGNSLSQSEMPLVKAEDDRPLATAVARASTPSERAAKLSERVQALRMPPLEESPRSAKLPWVLCAVLVPLSLWLGYVAFIAPAKRGASSAVANSTASGSNKSDSSAKPVASAKAGTSEKDQKVVLESKGYIIAAHQILVSPKVSGTCTRLTIEEGSRVKRGDILAEIEDVDYRTDYERCVGELDSAKQKLLELERGNRPEEISQAKAQMQEAEAQLTQLEADWNRIQLLRQKNVATAADFDATRSKFWAMQRQVERLKFAYSLMQIGFRKERIDGARADVQTAESNLEKAKWKFDNCKIRSPIAGTILKKNAEEGNLVNAIAFSGSVSLCEMADLSDLEVDLTIQERDVSRVFKGQKCKVRAEAYPDRVYTGVVSRLMPIADRSKGAIPVRVKLTVPREEEGVYLKPEMGAIVTFYKAEG